MWWIALVVVAVMILIIIIAVVASSARNDRNDYGDGGGTQVVGGGFLSLNDSFHFYMVVSTLAIKKPLKELDKFLL